jgi:hypothetical protein
VRKEGWELRITTEENIKRKKYVGYPLLLLKLSLVLSLLKNDLSPASPQVMHRVVGEE